MRLIKIILFVLISFVGYSQNYHDTQGKLNINNGGQANFNIPIAMPPSISNVGPTINLSYLSGATTGIAGQSWNISSISSISRVSTRLDIDGFRDGVDFDQHDRLSLDGQFLLLKSGTYFQSGAEYITEVQSNIKIQQIGSGNSVYFLVTAPDGSRSWYGNFGGQNAADVNSFYITRFEDSEGNFIIYDYIIGNNTINIHEIRFSANIHTNPTPLNKILFTYRNTLRKETTYFNGQEITYNKILDKIEVFTNNLLFKRYQLTHQADSNGYERVVKVQEFNANNEPANPIDFEYNTTDYNANEVIGNYGGIFNSSFEQIVSGDFDGDGKLDFANKDKIYLNMFSSRNFTDNVVSLPITLLKDKTIAITTLLANQLAQSQQILKIEENNNSIDLKTYSLNNQTLNLSNSKNIIINNMMTECSDVCNPDTLDSNGNIVTNPNSQCNSFSPVRKNSNVYLEGDFNGDAISELLIINFNEKRKFIVGNTNVGISDPDGNIDNSFTRCLPNSEIIGVNEIRIIDLNPNNLSLEGTIGNYSIVSSQLNFLVDTKQYVIDINGDGKTDLFAIKNTGEYKVFTFTENSTLQQIQLELIGEGLIPDYNITKPMLFGDYNGDGKTEFMTSDAVANGCSNCNLWHIYFSNPKPNSSEIFEKISKPIVEYWRFSDTTWQTVYHANQYYAIDVNKDGKTDLVRVWMNKYQPNPFWDDKDWDTKWRYEAYINDLNFNNQFTNQFVSREFTNEDPTWPLPIVSNLENIGKGRNEKFSSDIVVLRWYGKLEYLDVQKDYTKDNQLIKIKQSNNAIIDEIEYKTLTLPNTSNFLGSSFNFYSSGNQFNYPLVEFRQMSNYNAVSVLKNTSAGKVKKQEFKYHGLTFDVRGIGMIGFKKVARSNWYENETDNKIWNVTTIDPLKRGAIVNNITFKPSTNIYALYQDFPSHDLLINQQTFTFNQNSPQGTFPYVLLKNSEKSNDYLSGNSKETFFFYSTDGYYLINKTISKNFTLSNPTIQGTSQVETFYDNVTSGSGAGYFIGRPKETITTSKIFVNTIPNNSVDNSNTQVASEKIFYVNGNISKTEKSSNGSTEIIVEDFEYFPNGLLKKKTLSATGTNATTAVTPVVTEYTYDTTNRFVKTTKNVNDNHTVTNNTYHPVYGLVTSFTNAFGQTASASFDNWGKNTSTTDFLGKTVTFTYSRNGNVYTTLQTANDGSASSVEQDELAREIRRGSIDLNGNWTYTKTEYDAFGRKYRISEPYFGNATPTQWSTIEYDLLSRPIKTTAHTGKIVNTVYSKDAMGSIVTANEPLMSKTKFLDANGLTYKAIDNPGGTITYKFDANGNLLESDYEGIKTKVQYDQWGRRTRLEDTSAGVYTYSYDAFSRVKTETTPKGATTYTYDAGGRIATKVLGGLTAADATSMSATYTYDPTTKWLMSLAITNPIDGNSSYEYTYDNTTKLLNSSTERLFTPGSSTPVATFTKSLTFGQFGRVQNETSTASSYGKTSTKVITHLYKNGFKWQLKDGSLVIWQANNANSRGQLTSAQYGNGISITNSYDNFGYLSEQKHSLGTANTMILKNEFEPVLGNLTSRYNSLFDSKEKFEYDSLDRLVKWDGTSTNVLNLPFNSGTDGFTFTSTLVNGSVSNQSGTLRVVLKAPSVDPMAPIAAQRNLTFAINNSDQLRVRATITNKSVTRAAIIKAVMVETDQADPNNFMEFDLGVVENGNFEALYTVSDYIQNPTLRLRFIIDPSSIDENDPLNPDPESINVNTVTASFNVDNLLIDKIPVFNQNYDNRGRITSNFLGDYRYNETENKPYQNKNIKLTPQGQSIYNDTALGQQDIKYNMFSSPYNITVTNKDNIDISYNINEQRSIMYWGNTNTNKNLRPFRRYYSSDGSMEVTANFTNNNFTTPSSVEIITFVAGNAYSADVVVKNTYTGTATTPTGGLFYLHRDYQGTIVAITNATGGLVEKRQFDAWGLLTKVQNGAGVTLAKLTFFDRGYTGHEHLESVGLINMNGRVYDPMLHRFLQADSMVQEPYNTQNYNRYGYCLNNPLKYTDISGEDFGVSFAIAMGVALAVYFGDALINDRPITFRGIATTVVTTAVSAGISYGIGSAVVGINNLYVRATVQALAHGTAQGTLTAIQGGKFWTGFATGSLSSVMSSLWQGGEHITDNGNYTMSREMVQGLGGANPGTVGTMFFGTISGGAGAAISGGNFWQGAVTGMIVSGLNHTLHEVTQPKPKYKVIRNTKEALDHYYNGKGKSVIIGKESTNELRNSPEYQRVISRLKSGVANNLNGSFDVDMTTSTFHIGDTNVNYATVINSNGTVTTTFTEFVNDGFWDPDFVGEAPEFLRGIAHPSKFADGMGPNLEIGGGTPYRYLPSTYTIIYKNPGYKN